MVEFVSWIAVGLIAFFAVVGFTGVVVTGVLSAARALRHRAAPTAAVEVLEQVAPAA